MLKLLPSGDEGALLQAYEEDSEEISSIPALSWEIIIAREWDCGEINPALFWTPMIKRCWYIIVFLCNWI